MSKYSMVLKHAKVCRYAARKRKAGSVLQRRRSYKYKITQATSWKQKNDIVEQMMSHLPPPLPPLAAPRNKLSKAKKKKDKISEDAASNPSQMNPVPPLHTQTHTGTTVTHAMNNTLVYIYVELYYQRTLSLAFARIANCMISLALLLFFPAIMPKQEE